MRDVDPFCYFSSHASAIRGYGGDNRSPDPQYCFHTHYLTVRPGTARYELRLLGARASYGQLTVRVHAFKPSTGANASLVAGTRLETITDDREDLSVSVRFHAMRDVEYAFYGFFSEQSDISVEAFSVILDEPEGEEDDYIEPPVSAMQGDDGPREVRPANALIHYHAVDCRDPVSQDCTVAQLAEIGQGRNAPGDALRHWREVIALAAMTAYGAVISGLDGWVVGDYSPAMREHLEGTPFSIKFVSDRSEAISPDEFADFLLWPAGPGPSLDLAARWASVQNWLGRLKMGGLAVIGLRYKPQDRAPSSSVLDQNAGLTRNEIGQWAMRLIGDGYSIAPLAYAAPQQLAVDDDGFAAFSLIVRRQ